MVVMVVVMMVPPSTLVLLLLWLLLLWWVWLSELLKMVLFLVLLPYLYALLRRRRDAYATYCPVRLTVGLTSSTVAYSTDTQCRKSRPFRKNTTKVQLSFANYNFKMTVDSQPLCYY